MKSKSYDLSKFEVYDMRQTQKKKKRKNALTPSAYINLKIGRISLNPKAAKVLNNPKYVAIIKSESGDVGVFAPKNQTGGVGVRVHYGMKKGEIARADIKTTPLSVYGLLGTKRADIGFRVTADVQASNDGRKILFFPKEGFDAGIAAAVPCPRHARKAKKIAAPATEEYLASSEASCSAKEGD